MHSGSGNEELSGVDVDVDVVAASGLVDVTQLVKSRIASVAIDFFLQVRTS
jgi:hypothetical protein